jgi:hypothetical protein
MSLYDRVAAIPGGERALAVARLRRSVLAILHRAFNASELDSQAELAKGLRVRRSAVNQVFRGDGNVRISTLAEYLYEMGFEVDVTLVKAGELRTAAVENRSAVPAFAAASPLAITNYGRYDEKATYSYGYGYGVGWQQPLVLVNAGFSAVYGITVAFTSSELGGLNSAWPGFKPINLSDELASSGASS